MPPVPRPRARLAALNTTPTKSFARGPRGPPKAPANKPQKPVCPHCKGTDLFEDNGELLCNNCMVQVAQANIVSDVTFEENAGGRSTVQGAFVTENSRHAKTFGSQALRRIGNNDRNYAADIEANGRRALDRLAPKLGIADNIRQQALSIWTLAANIQFSAGRKTDEVAAACLYAACRRQVDNNILLMDLAEELHVNVFRLGEVYKDLCKDLYLAKENVGYQHIVELEPLIHKYCQKLQFNEMTPVVANDALRIIRRMNRDWIVSGRHPAGLCGACIILAARMNNFNRSVREVVFVSKIADATIAKRVEEFRRTKSAALTVTQFREFGNRMKFQHDPPALHAKDERNRLLERQKRRRREYETRINEERDSQDRGTIEIPDDESDTSSTSPDPEATQNQSGEKRKRVDHSRQTPASSQPTDSSSDHATATLSSQPHHQPGQVAATAIMSSLQLPTPESTQTQTQPAPRIDAEGFAIPALPQTADPNASSSLTNPETTSDPEPRKKGRSRKKELPITVVISEEELAEEDYLEAEIGRMLADGQVMEARLETEKAKEEERLEKARANAEVLAQQQQQAERERARALQQSRASTWAAETNLAQNNDNNSGTPPATNDSILNDDDDDLAREFANDPEVNACLLTPEESRIKEQIWVAHNEDWLRRQAEKDMLASIARASDPNYDPANPTVRQGGTRRRRKNANGKDRKKYSRMGDGSVLTEHSTPIETPADAARAMMERRMPVKSQFVDFSALQRIYGRESATPSHASNAEEDDDAASRNQTPVPGSGAARANPADDRQSDAEDDIDDHEDDFVDPDSTRPPIRDATWDDVHEPEAGGDDDAEDVDFRKAIGIGTVDGDDDDFGGFDDGDYGEEYE